MLIVCVLRPEHSGRFSSAVTARAAIHPSSVSVGASGLCDLCGTRLCLPVPVAAVRSGMVKLRRSAGVHPDPAGSSRVQPGPAGSSRVQPGPTGSSRAHPGPVVSSRAQSGRHGRVRSITPGPVSRCSRWVRLLYSLDVHCPATPALCRTVVHAYTVHSMTATPETHQLWDGKTVCVGD